MIRSYLVLAVTAALLLTAAFATGLAASAGPRESAGAWGGVHLVTSLVTVIAVLGIHSIVYVYLTATVHRAKEVSRTYGLPDWIIGQAGRNKGRADRFIMGGVATVAAAAWLGVVVDSRGGSCAPWHLATASFALGFNAVAFLIEYAGVVSHRRLLAEMKAHADLARLARGGGPTLDPETPDWAR